MFSTHASSDSNDNHNTDRGGDDGTRPPIDYRPLRDAGRLALKWLLDVARTGAAEPEDREAIDRVERASLATIAGMPMCCRPAELHASQEDVLVTAAILIERLEIDFRIPGLSQIFGSLYESLDWWQRSATPTTCVVSASRATSNHAVQRHAGVGIPSWIATWLSQPTSLAPRVVHGAGESSQARVFVIPVR